MSITITKHIDFNQIPNLRLTLTFSLFQSVMNNLYLFHTNPRASSRRPINSHQNVDCIRAFTTWSGNGHKQSCSDRLRTKSSDCYYGKWFLANRLQRDHLHINI